MELPEDMPKELKEWLQGIPEDQIQARVEQARSTLEDTEDFFVSVLALYVSSSKKRTAQFREFLENQNKRKGAPHRWFNALIRLSDDLMIDLCHKVIVDCQRRTQIRRAFKEQAMGHEILPVQIPGFGRVMSKMPESETENDPPTGMYL